MTYSTVELLDGVRRLDPFMPFLLNLVCPGSVTFGTQEIAFDAWEADMKLAPFVSPYVPGQISQQPGGEVRKFKAPYLKPKDVVDPARVLVRRPGESFSAPLSPVQRADAIRMDIMDTHRQKIRRREEWMIAQILRTGQVTVSGPKYPTSLLDFRRDANLTIDISGGAAAWDQTTAKPVEDLEDWFAMLESPATHVIFGRGAFRRALESAAFKELVDSRRGSDTQLEMAPAETDAFYRGRLGGSGPELWTYSGWYHDANGTKQFFVPDNEIIIVSAAGSRGVRAYGAILDANAQYQEAELWPKNFTTDDPGQEYIMTQSGPLPVVRRIDATMGVTVY
ncbi:major capsid protein [Marinobacter pelagius]|uniref:Phage major capsid protein E n=1 Tax=Marinobacter pelagius TaxID=379482 RepID=A0A1I4T3Z6_9GAMM|nr:major capsid protein [Marinobacter pelagius]SFM71442.1 Phage major capsid protein E [Marinobacter pelagius]